MLRGARWVRDLGGRRRGFWSSLLAFESVFFNDLQTLVLDLAVDVDTSADVVPWFSFLAATSPFCRSIFGCVRESFSRGGGLACVLFSDVSY